MVPKFEWRSVTAALHGDWEKLLERVEHGALAPQAVEVVPKGC